MRSAMPAISHAGRRALKPLVLVLFLSIIGREA